MAVILKISDELSNALLNVPYKDKDEILFAFLKEAEPQIRNQLTPQYDRFIESQKQEAEPDAIAGLQNILKLIPSGFSDPETISLEKAAFIKIGKILAALARRVEELEGK